MDKNLVDWYSSYLISRKDKIQSISRTVVADAFFSKETFITPMCENDFHVISRFRNDVILHYPTLEKKTGKRGHPKWFDGRIDWRTRQTLWGGCADANPKTCCQTIYDCQKVVPLHYESE